MQGKKEEKAGRGEGEKERKERKEKGDEKGEARGGEQTWPVRCVCSSPAGLQRNTHAHTPANTGQRGRVAAGI